MIVTILIVWQSDPVRPRVEKQVDGAYRADGWQLRHPQAIGKGAAHHEEGRGAARGGGVSIFVRSYCLRDLIVHEKREIQIHN